MRATTRIAWGLVLLALSTSAAKAEDSRVSKTPATERAQRRAYDGAPPVIPHARVGAACTTCHCEVGMAVPELGLAPPSPHANTQGLSALSRCEQCHVFRATTEVWRATTFEPLPQDLRHGRKFHHRAPPVIPHKVFMRENCAACHTGPAAREEIRSSHPERQRCRQCHLEQQTTLEFERKEQREETGNNAPAIGVFLTGSRLLTGVATRGQTAPQGALIARLRRPGVRACIAAPLASVPSAAIATMHFWLQTRRTSRGLRRLAGSRPSTRRFADPASNTGRGARPAA